MGNNGDVLKSEGPQCPGWESGVGQRDAAERETGALDAASAARRGPFPTLPWELSAVALSPPQLSLCYLVWSLPSSNGRLLKETVTCS